MIRFVLFALAWGCGSNDEAPPPAPTVATPSAPPQGKAPAPPREGPAPRQEAPPSPTAPAEPSVAPAELAAARRGCDRGFAALREGQVLEASLLIDEAIRVLEHAGDANALGMCRYNQGRVAEERLDIAVARQRYRESLAVRPNETVAARLASLGEREVTVSDAERTAIVRELSRHAVPCPVPDACAVRILAAIESHVGPPARAVLFEVAHGEFGADETQDERIDRASRVDEPALDVYLAIGDATGALRPRARPILQFPGDLVLRHDLTSSGMAFVDAGDRALLAIDVAEGWTEHCCGGRSGGTNVDRFYCDTTAPDVPCLEVPLLRSASGSSDDPDDRNYQGTTTQWSASVAIRGEQLVARTLDGHLPEGMAGMACSLVDASRPLSALFAGCE